MERDILLQICEDAVVPCAEWNNRDSYLSQVQLSDIYGLLETGAEYEIQIEEDSILIQFPNLPEGFGAKVTRELDYDTREDYFNLEGVDSDDEMFEGYGLEYNDYNYKVGDYVSGYLPTRERLTQVDGGDWY